MFTYGIFQKGNRSFDFFIRTGDSEIMGTSAMNLLYPNESLIFEAAYPFDKGIAKEPYVKKVVSQLNKGEIQPNDLEKKFDDTSKKRSFLSLLR